MNLQPLAICLMICSTTASGVTQDEADALFAEQSWADAARAYRSVVAEDTTNAAAWFRLGVSNLNLQQPAASIAPFEQAASHGFQPAGAPVLYQARAHAALGNADAALTLIERWIASGSGGWLAAMNAPEFEELRNQERFVALIAPLKPCTAEGYRQFDFWLGDWDVVAPASPGNVSRNTISSINGGCTLLEEYDTPGGFRGTSLNFYDGSDGKWHQTWADNQGGTLFLEGGLEGRAMVLRTVSDPSQINRVTWTPLDDGRVRQHWELSTDGGDSWSTVFDGYYKKR